MFSPRTFPGIGRNDRFERKYKCYSVMMFERRARDEAEFGGKVFLPPNALQELVQREIQYPMMFALENRSQPGNTVTHCGVLEFTADPGLVYMPQWMMSQLCLQEGDIVTVTNVSLQTATYAKFQPQSVDFLDITNPKAVLENTMRRFSCLTEGDIFAIKYNDKIYEICVLELQPNDHHRAVSIVECDMQLEFAAPLGYKEPERIPQPASEESASKTEEIEPLIAAGFRLDGKKIKNADSNFVEGPSAPAPEIQSAAAISEYALEKARATVTAHSQVRDFVPGKLVFKPAKKHSRQVAVTGDPASDSFRGQGKSLKSKPGSKTKS